MIMDENQQVTTKLQLVTNDELWNKVLKYKIDRDLKNNNLAVEELINKGLEPTSHDKELITNGFSVPDDTLEKIKNFKNKLPLYEKRYNLPIIIIKDEKSKSFFVEVHISASNLIKFSDPDATIDPELQEEFRANRELEPDNYYFLQMIDDAKMGRTFSDIVIEYNDAYKEENPLKILGGQHRLEAIKRSEKDKPGTNHGIKVYFNLNKEQRAEIMRISNTNINVSPDLRDRIEEQRLTPANMLRNFCYDAGILKKGEDFGDKRRYEEDFSPTVRMMRTFIVDFFDGLKYKGDIDKDAHAPYICATGQKMDEEYISIFNKFKSKEKFDDEKLLEAGKMFAKLHDAQYQKADKIKSSSKKEYKIKAFSLSIISSWAFATGVLQSEEKRLTKLYSLPEYSEEGDPLNAIGMSKAHHKTDPENYRGLGTRTDEKERGRLLQLFLDYSNSDKKKITQEMCNSSIDTYHANKSSKEAEEKRKKAF